MSQPDLTPEVVVDEVRRRAKAERDEETAEEIERADRLAQAIVADPPDDAS